MNLEDAYRLFRARVVTWARLAGVPEGDADDVAQEAFRVFEKSGTGIADAAVPAWLRTATQRQARHYKARAARRREREGDAAKEREAKGPWQERALGGREVEAVILGFVARLNPKRREVFIRHVLGEEPMEDVAAALGIPLPTAWRRLGFARDDLRKALERARAEERRRSRGSTSFAFAPLLFFSSSWRHRAVRIIVLMLFGAAALPLIALSLDDAPQLAPTAEEPIVGRAVEVTPLLPVAFVEAPHEREAGGVEAHVEADELAEHDLVALARRALAEGSPARARGFLDRADRSYPTGAFLPERAQLRARAAP